MKFFSNTPFYYYDNMISIIPKEEMKKEQYEHNYWSFLSLRETVISQPFRPAAHADHGPNNRDSSETKDSNRIKELIM